jgi:hypothetical protein
LLKLICEKERYRFDPLLQDSEDFLSTAETTSVGFGPSECFIGLCGMSSV